MHRTILAHRIDTEGRLEACPTIRTPPGGFGPLGNRLLSWCTDGPFVEQASRPGGRVGPLWSRLPGLVHGRALCGAGFQAWWTGRPVVEQASRPGARTGPLWSRLLSWCTDGPFVEQASRPGARVGPLWSRLPACSWFIRASGPGQPLKPTTNSSPNLRAEARASHAMTGVTASAVSACRMLRLTRPTTRSFQSILPVRRAPEHGLHGHHGRHGLHNPSSREERA